MAYYSTLLGAPYTLMPQAAMIQQPMMMHPRQLTVYQRVLDAQPVRNPMLAASILNRNTLSAPIECMSMMGAVQPHGTVQWRLRMPANPTMQRFYPDALGMLYSNE